MQLSVKTCIVFGALHGCCNFDDEGEYLKHVVLAAVWGTMQLSVTVHMVFGAVHVGWTFDEGLYLKHVTLAAI